MLSDGLYLENLREFVEDERRIKIHQVSYKWLSRRLSVPVDASKQMLYAYVEQSRLSGDGDLTVIYAITGVKRKGKLLQVALVREEELNVAKRKFHSLKAIHIFSIQKSKIKESNTLFAATYDICKENILAYSRWSPISCPASEKEREVAVEPQKEAAAKAEIPVQQEWLNETDVDDSFGIVSESRVTTDSASQCVTVSQKIPSRKVSRDSHNVLPSKSVQQKKRKHVQLTVSSDEEKVGSQEKGQVGKEGAKKAEAAVRRRKRVKRLKSKMYTTDDGAMVTEKVWESESTDDETERESKPAKIKKPGTARAKTGATKQSLISNFFRK